MGKDGRITCPKCGRDLGPIQPLPGTLTLCKACRLWVNNENKETATRALTELAGPSRG